MEETIQVNFTRSEFGAVRWLLNYMYVHIDNTRHENHSQKCIFIGIDPTAKIRDNLQSAWLSMPEKYIVNIT